MNRLTLQHFFLFFASALMVSMTGCKQDGPETPEYEIPQIYAFDNVDYSGQTQRLAMLLEMKQYMSAAVTGSAAEASRLRAMYTNDAANASWSGTYEASKQLKGKTFAPVQDLFETFIDSFAIHSAASTAGQEGVAGPVSSNDGTKTYLLGPKGIEYLQLIEKGLMGACFYYQATGVYLEPGKMDVDNTTVTEGKGTEMEHHWDEAFGYLGVPIDFPSNSDGLFFWGTYCNRRDDLLGTNQAIMDPFILGRAAISNDDLPTRDSAITEVRRVWEEVVAGTGLHYLNAGYNNFEDMALRAHALSEAIAFIWSLQFSPQKSISNDQVNQLLSLFAGSSDFADMNLYQIDKANILQARNELAGLMGWETIQDQF